jgi:hypothetical protein
MRSAARLWRWIRWAPLLAVAAALLLAARACREPGKGPTAARLDRWGLPDLLAHLHGAGLGLHVVPAARDGGLERGAFLTADERGWEELNALPKVPERADRWGGVVFVERRWPGEAWEVRSEVWGDRCVVAGPFVFFGDPALLDRVRDALGPAASGPRPS